MTHSHRLQRPALARGMTLIEVIFVMAILALLMSMALSLYLQGSQHFARTSTDLDAEREARAAMAATTSELRQAMPPIGGSVPVVGPTAAPLGASPSPTSQVTFYKVEDIASTVNASNQIDTTKLVYDCVVIQPTAAPAPPAGLPTPAENLEEITYKQDCTTLLQSRIIGHDVADFKVVPEFKDTYDIKITTLPLIRKDLQDPSNSSLYSYTLTSTVFVSYFPTNIR